MEVGCVMLKSLAASALRRGEGYFACGGKAGCGRFRRTKTINNTREIMHANSPHHPTHDLIKTEEKVEGGGGESFIRGGRRVSTTLQQQPL